MTDCLDRKIVIRGVTSDGRTFRPSNWAERLAGVMSPYRPQAMRRLGDHISYSPWCMPGTDGGVRCLFVDVELREHYPQAWAYIEQFARENDLQVQEHQCQPAAANTGN